MATRRTFTADFKTKVALDALQGDQTVQQIASKYKITSAQVSYFKERHKRSIIRLSPHRPLPSIEMSTLASCSALIQA